MNDTLVSSVLDKARVSIALMTSSGLRSGDSCAWLASGRYVAGERTYLDQGMGKSCDDIRGVAGLNGQERASLIDIHGLCIDDFQDRLVVVAVLANAQQLFAVLGSLQGRLDAKGSIYVDEIARWLVARWVQVEVVIGFL